MVERQHLNNPPPEDTTLPRDEEPRSMAALLEEEPAPVEAAPSAQPAPERAPDDTASADTGAPDLAAERARLEAEYQRREASIRGNWQQAQRRAEEAEQQRLAAEQRLRDQEADYDRRLQAARDATEDPDLREAYQRELQKRAEQRELQQREAQAAMTAAQAQQIIQAYHQREWEQTAELVRQQTVPVLTGFVEEYGQQLGLPAEDIKSIRQVIDSDDTKSLFAGLDPQAAHHTLLGFGRALERLLPAMQERSAQAAQRQAASSGAYRREGGTGANGAPEPDISKFRNSGDVLGLLETLYPPESAR